MDRFGLIGFPIEHSKSPELFCAAYNGKYTYELIEEEDFNKAWQRFIEGPYKAINVTAPFKGDAARMADYADNAVLDTGAANILIKTKEGIAAYNSDYLGVQMLLRKYAKGLKDVLVIGGGGAGKAARAASESLGYETKALRHNELKDGAQAEVVIFTLPRASEGCDRIKAKILIEANYRDPAFGEGRIAVPKNCKYSAGMEWLVAQAVCGYELMCGEKPDEENLNKCINLR